MLAGCARPRYGVLITGRLALALALALSGLAPAGAAEAAVERIVVIRHGEKPDAGLGQLSCRALARAIALPDVLLPKFGRPEALFAPNPAHRKKDRGREFDYIRPLATIEPLAIRLGLPVDVRFGFDQDEALVQALDQQELANKLVVVAWEHRIAASIVRRLLAGHGGSPEAEGDWDDDDFDRIDVVEIDRTPGQPDSARYGRDRQNLDQIPGDCPRL